MGAKRSKRVDLPIRGCAVAACAAIALGVSTGVLAQSGPQVEVEASTFNTRIAFDPKLSTYGWRFGIPGYRNLYCAKPAPVTTGQAAPLFSFDFKHLLLARMRGMELAALRRALDDAAKSADREAQFRALFGVDLPPSSGLFSPAILGGPPANSMPLLEMGQEVTIGVSSTYECMTPSQVDLVNAEAKRVYTAVIAAMQTPQLQRRRP